jgi:hypothetical protein
MAQRTGVTPLEWMLAIMRNDQVDIRIRAEMAKAAAPFVHARLSPKVDDEDASAPISGHGANWDGLLA